MYAYILLYGVLYSLDVDLELLADDEEPIAALPLFNRLVPGGVCPEEVGLSQPFMLLLLPLCPAPPPLEEWRPPLPPPPCLLGEAGKCSTLIMGPLLEGEDIIINQVKVRPRKGQKSSIGFLLSFFLGSDLCSF